MRSWSVVALGLTAVCIGIPLTANGALLFHLDGAPTILFSALFFGGFGGGTVIGGRVADRVPPARVLLAGCTGVTIMSISLPLWASVWWVLLCRSLLGLWVGSVFVSGARLASLHPRALFMQGIYGGCLQLGAGLGVLLTPALLSWLQAQGALFFWATGSLAPIALWCMLLADAGCPSSQHQVVRPGQSLTTALRLPIIWKLGMVHAGTFGLGTGIAVWVTAYLAGRYHLSLPVAAALGSGYVLAGVIMRPLGGLLVQSARSQPLQVIQLAVLLSVLGAALLIMAPTLPLALGATVLLALGMNLPYASVLTLAARYGQRTGIGMGSAQGAVILLLCLGLICLPILMGAGMAGGQPFTASGFLFGTVALFAAWTLRQEPLELSDGNLDAINCIHHQDDYSTSRPALFSQGKPLPRDGTVVDRLDSQQEGVLHHV